MAGRRQTTPAELTTLNSNLKEYEMLSSSSDERNVLIDKVERDIDYSISKDQIRKWFNNKLNRDRIQKSDTRLNIGRSHVNLNEHIPISLNSHQIAPPKFDSVFTVPERPI